MFHPETLGAWMQGSADYPVPRPSDNEYFVYGPDQEAETMRNDYLWTTLVIGESYDNDLHLLNPMVIAPDGEWEVWFFASWLPGANRFRSFWEMMEATMPKA